MGNEFVMSFVLVALAVALADVCWTMFFIETSNSHATKASVWSALIILCGSYSTVSYVQDNRLIIAAMIGAFIGTYLTIKFKKSKS